MECFNSVKDSGLLKHEIAYALGQLKMTNNKGIKDFLVKNLENE